MHNPLARRSLVSIGDLTKEDILFLLDLAAQFQETISRSRHIDLLNGHLLATLFYEPRTRCSSRPSAAMRAVMRSSSPRRT